MARKRRNAQIGLIAAIVLLVACLSVLVFQPSPTRAESEGSRPASPVSAAGSSAETK
jgi:hypothetical protein